MGLDLTKIKINTEKTLKMKDGQFPNHPVLTLCKVENEKGRRVIELSAKAFHALVNNNPDNKFVCVPKYVVDTNDDGSEVVNLVVAGTSEDKLTIDNRVIRSYKINKSTRNVYSKAAYDDIANRFDVDTSVDNHFMLKETDDTGVFTLVPYYDANLDEHEKIEVTVIDLNPSAAEDTDDEGDIVG